MKHQSLLGFINYHMFWTGLVICKYIDNKTKKTVRWGLRRIKTAFGHNDKTKIWEEKPTIRHGKYISDNDIRYTI